MTTTAIPASETPAAARPRVGFVSLGCPKNLVDSEVMMGLVHHNGAQLTPNAADADIIVINTCAFIDSAKQESVNTILEMVHHKTEGRAQKIIVAGCLVERYRDEIRKNIPEVDAVVGTGELEHILTAAGLTPTAHQRITTNPFNILREPATNPGAPSSCPATNPGAPSSPAVLSPERVGSGAPRNPVLTPKHRHQPSIQAHLQQDLAILPNLPVGDTLVHRAASSVHQHSRPESNGTQLQIESSDAPPNPNTPSSRPQIESSEDRANPIPPSSRPEAQSAAVERPPYLSSPVAPRLDSETWAHATPAFSGPPPTSRPEGNARQAAGRFSRESWDGATAALPDYLYSDATPRILATSRSSAYIKIAEGCDHPCSFCIIPQLRGKFRSRRIGSILAEAQNLIAQGVREITLIGQDTTCYGEDLGLSEGLAQLLDALAPLPGLKWLRFLYTYPNKVTTRLLETIARHPNIAKYLDVPLQHASPAVLKTMKRGGSGDIFLKLIEKARRLVPGIVIRTSFIVGFPGETEQDFQLLCDFVTAAKIDWLGVFTYSDEEGAKAFDLAPETKLPKRTIEARRRKLMRLQQKISARAKRALVGRELDILVEGPSEETELLWEGRTLSHAPEIDGKVFLNDFGPHETLVPGTFYRAQITESHDYDLVAPHPRIRVYCSMFN